MTEPVAWRYRNSARAYKDYGVDGAEPGRWHYTEDHKETIIHRANHRDVQALYERPASPDVEKAALRVVQAMFGGDAGGFTLEDAESQRQHNTQQWLFARTYAKAALKGFA